MFASLDGWHDSVEMVTNHGMRGSGNARVQDSAFVPSPVIRDVAYQARSSQIMSYDPDQIELAMCAIRVLAIIGAVAIVSYATRSRIVFLTGGIGSMLGFVVPEPVMYADYSSTEAAFLASLNDTASHVLYYGIIGASAGCAAGILLSRRLRRRAESDPTTMRIPRKRVTE